MAPTSPERPAPASVASVAARAVFAAAVLVAAFAAGVALRPAANLLLLPPRPPPPPATANSAAAAAVAAAASAATAGATAAIATEVPPVPSFFTHEDFGTYLGLDYLRVLVVDAVVAPYVFSYDMDRDAPYLADKAWHDRWAQQLGYLFENGSPDDSRLFVKYIGPEKGYGVFANVDISAGQPVIEYTGVLTNGSISDYMWTYPSDLVDDRGRSLRLGIDARFRGNMARFVNDVEDPNCDSIFVPYLGVWHVVYVSSRTIRAGEEVTVSYGDVY
ncbi:hypothetical protein HK405_006226, partial [Cladochytrium tenue]